jgi:formylglycine-generating enzyme required for sulfatase activity
MKSSEYARDLARAEKLLIRHDFAGAAGSCASILDRMLKDLYKTARKRLSAAGAKRLLSAEKRISGGNKPLHAFTLEEIVRLFRDADVFGPAVGESEDPLRSAAEEALPSLLDIGEAFARTGETPEVETVDRFCAGLKKLVAASPLSPAEAAKTCSDCGRAVAPDWKFCPVCESPIGAPACPACGKSVEPGWKRCPVCGERLITGGPPSASAADLSGRSSATEYIDPISGSAFVRVPAGSFLMGDESDDGLENEGPVHRVSLSSFDIGKFPVTQAEWSRVMGENPSHFKGDAHPVEKVTWFEAQEFIRRLAEMSGGKSEYRLPTEAEWEYAARSGGKRETYAGGDAIDPVAWYEDNSGGRTHPVGKKKENGLGLFDMSGNVWEWCLDVYREDAYSDHDAEDPVCLDGNPDRVIRGGGWNLDAWSARCTRRLGFSPEYSGPALGFRLVKVR